MLLRACAVLGLALCAALPLRAQDAAADERAVAAALHAAADSLVARVQPDGRFRYRIDGRGRERAGYNVVRHAGTLWALQDYHRRHPQAALREALERASRWLASCCLAPPPRWPLLAIWSVPEGEPAEAKLGAAGLALAAWNGMAAQGLAHPGEAQLTALARFIVYLQKPDGSFYSKHRDGRRDDRWTSLYYPGEAALGLLAQHARRPDPLWRESALLTLDHLARTRAASGDYPSDHWALIASAELARLEGAAPAALLAHARAVAQTMLAAQGVRGDFGHQRRGAPAATRLEGLLAARALLPADDPLQAVLDAGLRRGVHFLLQLPRARGTLRGALPRAARDSPDPRRDELRIDDTQHALSVWLGWCAAQKWSCTRP